MHMMKRCLTPALLLISLASAAQFRMDAGIRTGVSNYLGEMGGRQSSRKDFVNDLKLAETHFSCGAFVRYKVHPYIAVQADLSYGRISGDDKLSTNPGRAGRNLNFRNDIIELSLTWQFRIMQFSDVGRTLRYRNDFRAYGFAGLGCFYHNPKAYYSGTWIYLRPLKTEGQMKAYSKAGISIPMGIGLYYTKNRQFRIGWELGWRKTFTDYLDDVSTRYAVPSELPNTLSAELANRTDELTADPSFAYNYQPGSKRGDPTHKDAYVFSTINFSYVIKGRRSSNFGKPKYIDNYDVGRTYKKRTVRIKF
jgi:hypothetical protein